MKPMDDWDTNLAILGMLQAGGSNKEIAHKLHCSMTRISQVAKDAELRRARSGGNMKPQTKKALAFLAKHQDPSSVSGRELLGMFGLPKEKLHWLRKKTGLPLPHKRIYWAKRKERPA